MTERVAVLSLAFLAFLAGPMLPRPSRVAFTTGAELSWVQPDRHVLHAGPFESRTRGYARVEGTFPVRGSFALEFGGAYSQKGATITYAHPLRDRPGPRIRYSWDYFEFSALGRFSFVPAEKGLELHLVAGPALAVPVSCRKTDLRSPDPRDCSTGSIPGDFRVMLGGGLDLPVADRLGLTAAFRYGHGLGNVSEVAGTLRSLTFGGGLVYTLR